MQLSDVLSVCAVLISIITLIVSVLPVAEQKKQNIFLIELDELLETQEIAGLEKGPTGHSVKIIDIKKLMHYTPGRFAIAQTLFNVNRHLVGVREPAIRRKLYNEK